MIRNNMKQPVKADETETKNHMPAPALASRLIVDPNNTLLTNKK
jgi:hypothetical protein